MDLRIIYANETREFAELLVDSGIIGAIFPDNETTKTRMDILEGISILSSNLPREKIPGLKTRVASISYLAHEGILRQIDDERYMSC